MKTSQLQSLLAINARLIQHLHLDCEQSRTNARVSEVEYLKQRDYKEARWATSLIKRLAMHQRAIKDDIKGARTTKRVYKKHGKAVVEVANAA